MNAFNPKRGRTFAEIILQKSDHIIPE